VTLPIMTAAALAGSEVVTGWAARRADRESPVMRQVLQRFVDHGGPVAITEIEAAFPDRAPGTVREAVAALDGGDLLQLRDDRIEVAYPFSSRPTAFVVRLDDGRVRFACCAIDALGVAPMLARRTRVESECHHCRERIALAVGPDGPEMGAGGLAAGLMVWVETGRGSGRRITGL
jgi:hypothetical protein